ncbi:MAG: UDP-N-acetylglucosamine 2-epimerase (non-hydrolyzing) [Haliscomenobacter sp.]|nr:UDP-N-acetylglucosamine 2-epimerase (non-hydrolyzing) [Haliscomenobacter sp.]
MKKILAVIGARPQFIKHAPIELAAKEFPDLHIISVHTGQHYDENMSKVFFRQLGLRVPDYQLEIGSHSHGKQTGRMMEQIEEIVIHLRPEAMLVYGDTNSTLAGALVASKLNVPVFHVEAGLRSYNRKMPEEINRVLTDHVSSLLFIPTEQAGINLRKEGIVSGVIKTGDIMYDLLQISLEKGLVSDSTEHLPYYYATIHRPYNTDDPGRLISILEAFNSLETPVKFPIHPRTKNLLQAREVSLNLFTKIQFLDPVGYFENINLINNSKGVITDSGGVQKEAYFLKKKCITLRSETEWTETLENGWNHLMFDDLADLPVFLNQSPGPYLENLYGNGKSRFQILQSIENYFLS